MPNWDPDQTAKFVQQLLAWKDTVDAELTALKLQVADLQGGGPTPDISGTLITIENRVGALEARPVITQEQLTELDTINTKLTQLQQILAGKT